MIKFDSFWCNGFLWLDSPRYPRLGFENTLNETHYIRRDFSGWVISPRQKPSPHKTQHSQETDIHAPARFETSIPPRRRLQTQDFKPRRHRDGHFDASTWITLVTMHVLKTPKPSIYVHLFSKCSLPNSSPHKDFENSNENQQCTIQIFSGESWSTVHL
jgi:hypothetical protein